MAFRKRYFDPATGEYPEAIWVGNRIESDAGANPPYTILTYRVYRDQEAHEKRLPIPGSDRVYRVLGVEFIEQVSKPTVPGSRYNDQATAIDEYVLAKKDTPTGEFTEEIEEDGTILQIPVMVSFFHDAVPVSIQG